MKAATATKTAGDSCRTWRRADLPVGLGGFIPPGGGAPPHARVDHGPPLFWQVTTCMPDMPLMEVVLPQQYWEGEAQKPNKQAWTQAAPVCL